MLEDFISTNSLKARLLHFLKTSEASADCELYLLKNSLPVLVVKLSRTRADENKLKKIIGENFTKADEDKCFAITGYSLKFLPPITIYGIKVLIDKKAAEKGLLFFQTAEEQTLEISPKEILESNESSGIADLI